MTVGLTIIIPMYNAEKYIERCLDSILQQGLNSEEYQVLVMNDGSTDSSPEIVQKYIDRGDPIELHSHANVGCDGTRNKGFKYVKGKYVYIMDADDYLAYNCLHSLLHRALRDDLQIIAFDALFTGENALFEVETKPEDHPEPPIITGKEYLKTNRNTRFETWWFMVKTSFLEETGVRFETGNACSDTYYMLEHFLKADRIAYYPIKIYRYYDAPTSLTRNKSDGKYVARMYNDFSKTAVGFSDILLRLKEEKEPVDKQLWNNLTHRRDSYVFYLISIMTRGSYTKSQIKQQLDLLEQKNAYPIKNFIGPEYNSLKWRAFNFIFNQKKWLLNLVPVYRKFKRT